MRRWRFRDRIVAAVRAQVHRVELPNEVGLVAVETGTNGHQETFPHARTLLGFELRGHVGALWSPGLLMDPLRVEIAFGGSDDGGLDTLIAALEQAALALRAQRGERSRPVLRVLDGGRR
jgi:hypothetical protein